ncbi:LacI family DNA-binding transcriptional regulator [Sphingobacterium sp. UT-1RO-CII-1]|uniref:LacI family DNA-binding transcriptional regulator n=1 Tax=Sphingobacterium sp. UT-1RO-CII-1 TaxID=2995225 RepID=UPI00227ABB71|nr:LacI family DNA-binding transcriptional regulator [Sphingobacterium sp. UT-1RO-CII-1]MCY4779300.1 LacI family DNA-binding transcriptional regulator [Sphingobacterium sp. UT-1RO-CII-1]
MSQITIIDLAKRLGLSKSTVSRAFRDSSDISAKTKERILAMADELGFSPNLYASNLRVNRSRTIAIIIPEFGDNFFSQAIKGIELIARNEKYHTLIYVTDSNVHNEASIVRSLVNGRVDGVLISASGEGKDHSHLQTLIDHSIPVVFFDRSYEDIHTNFVTGNDFESSRLATQHLIDSGCDKIAYFTINQMVSIGKVRLEGYKKGLEDNGKIFQDHLLLDTENDELINRRDIRNFIREQKPDAIFASVERLAISTIRVAKEEGIRIPEDLKLICYSCLEIADLLEPSLSVVKQPAFEMGRVAAKYLMEEINEPKSYLNQEITLLSSSLLLQESTATT